MRKFYLLALLIASSFITTAQNVGIGTAAPLARLHVVDSNVVFSADGDVPPFAGNPPVSGAGRRMMWYAEKAAFRTGYVSDANWDAASIGTYSFASGYGSMASSNASTAMGYLSLATAPYSTAIGLECVASGNVSTALGRYTSATGTGSFALGGPFCVASGTGAVAMGAATTASGSYSTAMGSSTAAGGQNSTAMGNSTTASGNNSTAMGAFTTANGVSSTAMGNYVSTSNFNGAFAIGDNSTTTVMQSFVANGFRSRFAGGYRLLSNAAANLGVVLTPDATSWGVISDVRLKENFLQTDGEQILRKIAAMRLTTWNYKAQLNKNERHYGPMAQDFFAAFGKDDAGVIGNDTIINQADFDGVNLIAIQALEKRTATLQKENEELKARLEKLEKLMVREPEPVK